MQVATIQQHIVECIELEILYPIQHACKHKTKKMLVEQITNF